MIWFLCSVKGFYFYSFSSLSLNVTYYLFMAMQEARDCLLGRLFAYGALVHSGRLTEECSSDKNISHVKEITSVLISLAAKKRYLQEPAVSIILELIEKVYRLFNDILFLGILLVFQINRCLHLKILIFIFIFSFLGKKANEQMVLTIYRQK